MKNVWKDGQKRYEKEDTQPAVIEFLKRKGGEVSNKEIDDFLWDNFGVHFGNLSDYMGGVRDFDNRIVNTQRGYWKFVEVERISGNDEGVELLIKDDGKIFEKLQRK